MSNPETMTIANSAARTRPTTTGEFYFVLIPASDRRAVASARRGLICGVVVVAGKGMHRGRHSQARVFRFAN